MTKNRKVSIIIATYNHSNSLLKAIESAYNQSYEDLEVIVINDGSTDGTKDLLENLKNILTNKNRIIVINQENKGVIDARNTAINIATGDYIFPLDSDDFFYDDFVIEDMMKEITSADVVCVYGAYRSFGKKDKVNIPKDFNKLELLMGNFVSNSSLFRKDVFLKAGGYKNYMKDGYEDWELFIRMSNFGEFKKMDRIIFFYKMQDNSRNEKAIILDKNLREIIIENNIDIYSKNFLQIMQNKDKKILKISKKVKRYRKITLLLATILIINLFATIS